MSEEREAGGPLLESSGSLYWQIRGIAVCFRVICVSLCHEECGTGVSASVGVTAGLSIGV